MICPVRRKPTLLPCLLGIPVAKRKFAELELSLLHLQQNVEIPEVYLIIQSPIQRAVEAVSLVHTFRHMNPNSDSGAYSVAKLALESTLKRYNLKVS